MIQIWNVPNDSINGCSDFALEFKGLDVKLKITYTSLNVVKQIIINFIHVVCFRHSTNFLFMPNSMSFECLCEVNNSEWLKELKKFNSEYPIEKFKHFVIDNQNDGRFEVLAKSYSIKTIN